MSTQRKCIEFHHFGITSTSPLLSLRSTSWIYLSSVPKESSVASIYDQVKAGKLQFVCASMCRLNLVVRFQGVPLGKRKDGEQLLHFLAHAVQLSDLWASLGLDIQVKKVKTRTSQNNMPNLYFRIEHKEKSAAQLAPPASCCETNTIESITIKLDLEGSSTGKRKRCTANVGTRKSKRIAAMNSATQGLSIVPGRVADEEEQSEDDDDDDATNQMDSSRRHKMARMVEAVLYRLVGIKKGFHDIRYNRKTPRPTLLQLAPLVWNESYMKTVADHAPKIPVIAGILSRASAWNGSMIEKTSELFWKDWWPQPLFAVLQTRPKMRREDAETILFENHIWSQMRMNVPPEIGARSPTTGKGGRGWGQPSVLTTIENELFYAKKAKVVASSSNFTTSQATAVASSQGRSSDTLVGSTTKQPTDFEDIDVDLDEGDDVFQSQKAPLRKDFTASNSNTRAQHRRHLSSQSIFKKKDLPGPVRRHDQQGKYRYLPYERENRSHHAGSSNRGVSMNNDFSHQDHYNDLPDVTLKGKENHPSLQQPAYGGTTDQYRAGKQSNQQYNHDYDYASLTDQDDVFFPEDITTNQCQAKDKGKGKAKSEPKSKPFRCQDGYILEDDDDMSGFCPETNGSKSSLFRCQDGYILEDGNADEDMPDLPVANAGPFQKSRLPQYRQNYVMGCFQQEASQNGVACSGIQSRDERGGIVGYAQDGDWNGGHEEEGGKYTDPLPAEQCENEFGGQASNGTRMSEWWSGLQEEGDEDLDL